MPSILRTRRSPGNGQATKCEMAWSTRRCKPSAGLPAQRFRRAAGCPGRRCRVAHLLMRRRRARLAHLPRPRVRLPESFLGGFALLAQHHRAGHLYLLGVSGKRVPRRCGLLGQIDSRGPDVRGPVTSVTRVCTRRLGCADPTQGLCVRSGAVISKDRTLRNRSTSRPGRSGRRRVTVHHRRLQRQEAGLLQGNCPLRSDDDIDKARLKRGMGRHD